MRKMNALLVSQGGLTWAVDENEVRGITPLGACVAVQLQQATWVVDEVVGVQHDLVVHPVGATLRRFLPPNCLGLALVAGAPVALFDPNRAASGQTKGASHHVL